MFLRRAYFFLPLILLISGCPLEDHLRNKVSYSPDKESKNKIIESREISISCNKENIEDYKKEGWKVISSTETEVPCSWKTVKATKSCNLKKDKGCKITVPDVMGKKTTYKLEKRIKTIGIKEK